MNRHALGSLPVLAGLLGLVLIGLLTQACITTGARAREVEEGLIGMKALEIRRCLGDPTELEWDDETEVMIYSWIPPLSLERQEEERQKELEPYIPEAMRDRTPAEEREERWRYDPFCELRITLQDKHVTEVEADGRSENGLRLDHRCMTKASRCLPQP